MTGDRDHLVRRALRVDALPPDLAASARRLHREVCVRLRDMDLAVEHGRDPWTAQDLRCAMSGLRELLAQHVPGTGRRCPTCRTRGGWPARWPCHVWRTAHRLLGA